MHPDYVLKLAREVRSTLWGVEHWGVSALEECSSRIVNGPLAGQLLSQVMPTLSLLFKVIDAKERPSLQVHPNEKTAPLTGGKPKTEMWCMLEDGEFFAGFKPGVTRQDVERALESGGLEDMLVRHCGRKGDVFLIPGGLVHAIGDKTLLYEVQQGSMTTFRFYDWGRLDRTGKPRTLNIRESLIALDLSLPLPVAQKDISGRFFDFRQLELDGRLKYTASHLDKVVYVVSGTVSANGVELAAGDSALIPPGIACTLEGSKAEMFMTLS